MRAALFDTIGHFFAKRRAAKRYPTQSYLRPILLSQFSKSHVAPHAHVLHLPNERFSCDPKVVETMNNDPLIAHETQLTQTMGSDGSG